MQQQPLAFTLVKTVVSARDEGKALSPALATAWDLLYTELSPAHRVIASEVNWSPNHQEDLRFVIEGVRKQFEKDPDLESEFLAFLAEVEPFGQGENDSAILPVVIGITSGSSLTAPTGEISFDYDENEVSAAEANESIFQELQTVYSEGIEESVAQQVAEPELEMKGPEIEAPELSLETEQTALKINLKGREENVFESNEGADQAPQAVEPSNEISSLNPSEIASTVDETASAKVLEPAEHIGNDSILEDAIPDESPAEPLVKRDFTGLESKQISLLKYWPIAAIAFLIAALSFGIWTFSDAEAVSEVSTEKTTETPLEKPKDLLEQTSKVVEQEDLGEEDLPDEPPLVYSLPSLVELSNLVDSLRLKGDYASALKQQTKLTNRLVEVDSAPRETAQAYAELAILYASQENVLQAIVEQRTSLNYARQAFAKTNPAVGRSHLKLASFYTKSGELHMARAHLQQARQIFGDTQELISPTDLKASELISKRLEEAS